MTKPFFRTKNKQQQQHKAVTGEIKTEGKTRPSIKSKWHKSMTASYGQSKTVIWTRWVSQKVYKKIHNNVNENIWKVKELIEQNGFDVNQEITTRSPIHYAADYGQSDVLRYLITKGADVNVSCSRCCCFHFTFLHLYCFIFLWFPPRIQLMSNNKLIFICWCFTLSLHSLSSTVRLYHIDCW